ncbi:transmembrane protein 98 isoform X2 [Pongo abelii]|uniref:transmembrane protein 98 isoform X2 n=1 Tax=Pongo abelii TaxID=9601 RepID=UPI0030057B84
MGQSVAEHTGSAASPPAEPIGARRLGPPARGGAQAGTLRSPLRLPPGWATGGARKGCWVARARLPAAPAAGGPGGDGGAWRRGFGAGRGPGAGAGARGRGAGFLGPRRFPACSAAGPRPRPDFAIGGAVAGCAREPQPEALRSLQVSWRNLAAAILSPSLPLPAALAHEEDVSGTESGALWKHGDCGDCCHRCAGHHLSGFVCSLGAGLQAALLPATRPAAAL